MTGRCCAERTSICLVALLLVCLSGSNVFCEPEPVPQPEAEPEPMPLGLIYSDNFPEDSGSLLLLNRLKLLTERKQEVMEQERELTEEQLTIQTILEAKARDHRISQGEYSAEDPELLPVPSAVVHHGPLHSGKRTSYMTLCHFKICNMGRKRQM